MALSNHSSVIFFFSNHLLKCLVVSYGAWVAAHKIAFQRNINNTENASRFPRRYCKLQGPVERLFALQKREPTFFILTNRLTTSFINHFDNEEINHEGPESSQESSQETIQQGR